MVFFKHNWPWKVLSLAVAIMVAVFVRKQEGVTHRVLWLQMNIPVPAGQRVESPAASKQIRVDLDGPADAVSAISTEELKVTYDTSELRPGSRAAVAVPVTVELPEKYRNRVQIDWRPRVEQVRLVSDVTKEFTVTVKPLNRADGWELDERDPPRPNPLRVTVSGPQSAVNRVSSIVAPIMLDAEGRIHAYPALQAVTAEGNNITDQVTIAPAQVVVSGTQRPVVMQKRVLVQPQISAVGASGLSVDVAPARVGVTGSERALAGIYVVGTEPVRLPQGQTEVTREVAVVPPSPDVQVSPSRVRVTLRARAGGRPAPEPEPEPASNGPAEGPPRTSGARPPEAPGQPEPRPEQNDAGRS
jgi:YbbR domain-containing protein